MIDSFLFVGIPYIAIAVCVLGTIYRLTSRKFSYSALSSQFLESNKLLWGSVPWHIGIGLIIAAHILALVAPGLWHGMMSNRAVLYATEAAGVGLSLLALIGLATLIVRRITSSRIQAVTTIMDLIVLALLFYQLASGLGTAMAYRWGAMWATAAATPYIWSLLTFQPDPSLVAGLPLMVKSHIISAFVLIFLIPFSRLVHMFAVPLEYMFREPQKVVWTNPRHEEAQVEVVERQAARRYFIRSAVGVAAGGAFLSAGTAHKLLSFFFGPRLPEKEEARLMATRVARLEQTVEQKKYELERQQQDYIFIAKLSELSDSQGKYFIDYQMRPALAFKDTDGLPLLISAKCTHLGCTVGADCNAEGKILCPCHVSYFDIHTGQPNPDSPAKAPLPHIGWVLMDDNGKLVASKQADGTVTGKPDTAQLEKYSVFIAKYHEEKA